MRAVVGIVLAIVGCLGLFGCGSAKSDVKYRIVVVPKGLTHEHWQSVHRGALRAKSDFAEKGLAIEILWDGPKTENDVSAQVEILDRNLAANVSGFVLAPQHSKSMVPHVQKVVDAKIPVVILDSGLDNPDLYVKYVATDNYHGGYLAGEHLAKLMKAQNKPEAKLVLFRYAPGSESTEKREQGFLDAIAKDGPMMKIVSQDKYAGATVDTAQREAMTLLNSLTSTGMDGVFAPNESSATGTLRAMESLQLQQKVRLMGFDSSQPLLQAVKEGNVDGLILQDPYKMGYLGVWNVVQYLEGYDVAPKGEKVQSTGEHLVTKENVEATATRELFNAELQKARKIETPTYAKRNP